MKKIGTLCTNLKKHVYMIAKVRKRKLLRTLFLRRCWESCYNGAIYELIKMQIRTFKGIWQNGKQDHGGINTGPVQRDDRDNEDRGM